VKRRRRRKARRKRKTRRRNSRKFVVMGVYEVVEESRKVKVKQTMNGSLKVHLLIC